MDGAGGGHDPRPRLAAELRAARRAAGLSLKELERLTHVSDSSLSRYLAGRSLPPWSVVEALSRLAGRDAAALQPLWAAARASGTTAAADDLPRAPLVFVGRAAELDTLASEPGVWVVDGMAGVGKSTLAVQAARMLAEKTGRRALYLHLHGHTSDRAPLTPQAALASLLHAVGVTDRRIPEDVDERAALWRREAARQDPLLVLDDALDCAQARLLLPGGAQAVALVTSRRRLLALEGARSLTLGLPTVAECRELFAVAAGPGRLALGGSGAGSGRAAAVPAGAGPPQLDAHQPEAGESDAGSGGAAVVPAGVGPRRPNAHQPEAGESDAGSGGAAVLPAGVRPDRLDAHQPEAAESGAGSQPQATELAAVDAIIDSCGRLPLAVRLAASRLAHRPAWSAAFLADRLRAEDLRRRELGDAMRMVLAPSVEHLPEPVRAAFALLGTMPEPMFEVSDAAALWRLPPGEAETMLEALVDVHLLDEPAPRRYSQHRLVRDFAASLRS